MGDIPGDVSVSILLFPDRNVLRGSENQPMVPGGHLAVVSFENSAVYTRACLKIIYPYIF